MQKKNYIPSFIVAYLLSTSALNKVLGVFLNKSDGVMLINLAFVAALLVLHFFISDKKTDLNLNKKALLFVYYVVSLIVISKYAAVPNTYAYRKVLVYCFIPIYISFYKIDVEKILKFMMYLSFLVLPFYEMFFKTMKIGTLETIGMGTTYSILPFVVAAALHFFYYRKSAGFWCWIGYIVNVFYLVKILLIGNRGPMVTLLVLMILLILRKFDKEGNLKENEVKNTVIILFTGVAVCLLVNNFKEILVEIQGWLRGFDIQSAAIDKTVSFIDRGDLSNGREVIYKYTINCIGERWILGHGICTFLYNSMGMSPYPHNLFLQMWYDLGVIFSMPLLIILLRACIKTVLGKGMSKNYIIIMIFFFVLSVPELCYSGEFWTDNSFWIFVMLFVSPNIYEETSNTKDEPLNEAVRGDIYD